MASKRDVSFAQRFVANGTFIEDVRQATLVDGLLEHQFCSGRRWRFDIAWPRVKVALEIDGGMWARAGSKRCPVCGQIPLGGHSSGAQRQKEREKMNTAVIMGWHVLHTTWDEVISGHAHTISVEAIKAQLLRNQLGIQV